MSDNYRSKDYYRSISRNSELSAVDVDALNQSAEALLLEYQDQSKSCRDLGQFQDQEQFQFFSDGNSDNMSKNFRRNKIFPSEDSSEARFDSDESSGTISFGENLLESDLSSEEIEREIRIYVPRLTSFPEPDPPETILKEVLQEAVLEEALTDAVLEKAKRAEAVRRNSLPDDILPTTGRRSRSLSRDDLKRPVSALGDLHTMTDIVKSLPLLHGVLPMNMKNGQSVVVVHKALTKVPLRNSIRNAVRKRLNAARISW
ncbi:hypothetical protein SK128_018712, partial [Halocaridina rubra]